MKNIVQPTGEQLYAMVMARFKSGFFPWSFVSDSGKAAWDAAASDLAFLPDTIMSNFGVPLASTPDTGAVPDKKLLNFYRATDFSSLVSKLAGHIEKLQDSAKRNVKPWEDTFPPTLLPSYIQRIKDADSQEPVPAQVEKEPLPGLLKGIGKINGDGWKDTTEIGQLVIVWNMELPEPYSPGQYLRLGNPIYSASTQQYDFSPATREEVDAYLEEIRFCLLAEIRNLKNEAEPKPTPAQPEKEPNMTNARLHGCDFDGWQCFHCGEIFTTVGGAQDHFGFTPSDDPACRIKLGGERGLVMALREAEKSAAEAWGKLHDESGDIARAYHASVTRHREGLSAAEEKGYERGLADAKLVAAQAENSEQEAALAAAPITNTSAVDPPSIKESNEYDKAYFRLAAEWRSLREIIIELSQLEIAACAAPGSMSPGEDILGRLFKAAGVEVPADIRALGGI